MFYSQFILAKKGPLGTIWIAAHLERKLRKNQVADTDIGFSVDSILFPEMPIALRLSSHLLLGVVRIYSRKVNYLFDDCSEALLKVKQAFRSTAVDLPPEESTAPYHSITLPETFDLDDFELPGSEIFQGNYVDHHISSKEQITLQDTMEGVIYSTSKFGLDERFGDGDASGLDLEEELLVEKAEAAEHATGTSYSDVDPQASVQVNALFKYDHNQDTPTIPEAMPAGGIMYQHVDEYDGDDGPVEYAHAPCTPGLWEEPNLSNIQETSAYDDHQEPENHTISEFAVKENIENASSEQHHNEFEPLEKSLPHIATTEQMSVEQPPPHIVTTEQMSMNGLSSTPFTESHIVDQVSSMSPIVEMSETVVSVVDDPVKVVNLLNKNATHQEPEAQTDDRENYVEHQGISNNITHVVNQANAFHHTFELELNTEPHGEHNLVSPQDQAFRQPKDSTIPVQSTHDSMSNVDFMGLRPCVTLSNHDAVKHDTSLPPSEFTSLPSVETSRMEEHPSAYEAPIMVQGEIPLATESLERNFQETYRAEIVPSNVVQVASSIPNRQVENAIESEVQVHNNANSYNTNSYTSNFPAPEKVLSFSQGYSDVPKDLVPESTPIHQSEFASSISNRQVDSVSEREVQVNNSNSYTSNFPAPEKLLSFSQGQSDVPKNLVTESTPMIEPPGYGRDAGTNMYSGRKRSITESSMTNQSLNFNLNESSTFFNTNMTSESFRDDDLLSSILVGRNTSILKMNTPPTEVPSTKRRRQSAPKTAVPASKTGILKRKVLMDDNMVLHGDTIRQQLTNTEDIRRLRKKAPCTHSEILMIKKQFWEDELFGEAILTGMSNKLTSLHRQLYGISKIDVSQYDASLKVGTDQKSISHNDEKDIRPEMGTEYTSVSVELDALKENKEQDNFVPVPMKDVSEEAQPADVPEENKEHDDFDHVAVKEVSEAQPIEAPLVTDNHTHDNNTTDLEYYENQAQMHTTGDFTELFGPDHDILEHGTAMDIDGKSFPDADTGVPVMPVEAESLTHADVVRSDTFDTSAATTHVDVVRSETFDTSAALAHANDAPSDAFDTSAVLGEVEKTSQMVALLDGPPPGFGTYEKVDLQSADYDPPMDININNSFESNVASEIKLDDALVREIPEEKQELVADASTTFSSETDGLKSDILTLDQEDTGIRNNEVEIVNKDIECNPENLVSIGVFSEEFVQDPAYDTEANPLLGDVLLDEREKRGHHVTLPVTTLNLEDISADNRVDVDDADYMYSGVANDTDFLNFDDVDDDEAGDAADDDMPDGEETKILDNSGWSSRTRAVAKYLQIMFDKEGERGRNMLAVNNLLAGKTRKEASRMFFETLVLKTKDYIHVEQTDPFENINVFPRSKLLKSEF